MEPLLTFLKPLLYVIPILPIIWIIEKKYIKRQKDEANYLKEELYASEQEKLDMIEADLKQHLKTDGFDTEPKPFTQDDMRKWQMRNK